MFNEILTGPQSLGSDSAVTKARGGRTGEQIVSELQGRYYENVVRGNWPSRVLTANWGSRANRKGVSA